MFLSGATETYAFPCQGTHTNTHTNTNPRWEIVSRFTGSIIVTFDLNGDCDCLVQCEMCSAD